MKKPPTPLATGTRVRTNQVLGLTPILVTARPYRAGRRADTPGLIHRVVSTERSNLYWVHHEGVAPAVYDCSEFEYSYTHNTMPPKSGEQEKST